MRFRGYHGPAHRCDFFRGFEHAAHCRRCSSGRLGITVDALFGEEGIEEGVSPVASAAVAVTEDFGEGGEVPVCSAGEEGEGFPRAVGAEGWNRDMAEAVQDMLVEVVA